MVISGNRQEPQHTRGYRWVVLFTAFFSFVAFALVFQMVPPLLTAEVTRPASSLLNYFGLDEAQAGLLMSIVMVPGIILALPAGLLVNRYGFRGIGLLSIIAVAIGSLTTALANSFVMALLGRFILGIGGAFLIVGSPTIIPQWFSHEEMGRAMGIYSTNMPIATIIAFPAATILAQSFDWRYPFYVGAAVAIVAALVFVATVREGPLKGQPQPISRKEMISAIRTGEVWKASLIWMFFNTAAIAFLSWAPAVFHDFKGLNRFDASILASVFMYAAAIFVPIFGWASDKLGRRKPFMIGGSILMAVTLIGIAYAYDLPLVLLAVVLGVSAASVPPLVMAIAADSLPPRLSGTGFSVVTLCQNVGITLSAPLAGYLLQTTQSVVYTFLGISLFSFAAAIMALTAKTR